MSRHQYVCRNTMSWWLVFKGVMILSWHSNLTLLLDECHDKFVSVTILFNCFSRDSSCLCHDTTYAIRLSVMSRDMLRCRVLDYFPPIPLCYCNIDCDVATFLFSYLSQLSYFSCFFFSSFNIDSCKTVTLV